jgi:hypothetical protein
MDLIKETPKAHEQKCEELKNKWLDCCQKYGTIFRKYKLCGEKYTEYEKRCSGSGLRKRFAIFSTPN